MDRVTELISTYLQTDPSVKTKLAEFADIYHADLKKLDAERAATLLLYQFCQACAGKPVSRADTGVDIQVSIIKTADTAAPDVTVPIYRLDLEEYRRKALAFARLRGIWQDGLDGFEPLSTLIVNCDPIVRDTVLRYAQNIEAVIAAVNIRAGQN
jgi:hypothetical protein